MLFLEGGIILREPRKEPHFKPKTLPHFNPRSLYTEIGPSYLHPLSCPKALLSPTTIILEISEGFFVYN